MGDGKPRRKKAAVAILAAVACCVVVVAVAVCWHPWDSASGGQQTVFSTSSQGEAKVEEEPEPVESTQIEELEPFKWDAKWDGTDWKGKDEGYIGPNGEGGISRADYKSEEEYLKHVARYKGGIEKKIKPELIESPDGWRLEKGVLLVTFEKDTFSESAAHDFVKDNGGVWLDDDWYYNDRDASTVEILFEDCDTYEDLRTKQKTIEGAAGIYYVSVNDEITFDESDSYGNEIGNLDDYQELLEAMGFDKAWKAVRCDGDVTVAVVDVGFDLDHPDLENNIIFPWDAVAEEPFFDDCDHENGHGTRVSGVLSAVANNGEGIDGCSHNAKIMPVRWCGGKTDEESFRRYLLCALKYLNDIDATPDVVNMSCGSYEYDQRIQDVINELAAKGVVIVATAGNDDRAALRYPASYENVLSVGSVGLDDRHSSFSNHNEKVDICAVGERIYTTTNPHAQATAGILYDGKIEVLGETRAIEGTSFAAPQVSAAAALLKTQHPSWSAERVAKRLISTARKVSGMGVADRTDEYGYGVLDVSSAVGAASIGVGSGYGSAHVEEALLEGMAYLASSSDELPDDLQPTLSRLEAQAPSAVSYLPDPADHVKGAATGGASSALEMLGVDCVEDTGRYRTASNLADWKKPRYLLFGAQSVNSNPDPLFAAALSDPNTYLPTPAIGERGGYRRYLEDACLLPYGNNSFDDSVWKFLPDVVVGTGRGLADYGSSEYAGAVAEATGRSDYNPVGVRWNATTYGTLVDTMYSIARAADEAAVNQGKSLRYGPALPIAAAYEDYVKGTQGYILKELEASGEGKKVVACVESYDADECTYTLVQPGVECGMLPQNRWVETYDNVADDLGEDVLETKVVTRDQLSQADLVIIGGAWPESGPEADVEAILASFSDELRAKCFYVEGGTTGGTAWPANANGSDAAFNIGAILGCLYPEYVDQDDWVCYFYHVFCHVKDDALAEVVANAMDGVRNWDAKDSPTSWTTEDAATY